MQALEFAVWQRSEVLNDYTIVILEKMKTLAIRLRQSLEGNHIRIISVDTRETLFEQLEAMRGESISLIILGLEIEQEAEMKLLVDTKRRAKETPIIVLTSGAKRNYFVEAMLQGATDFIIKPFNESTLVTKAFKYLMPDTDNQIELVSLDLQKYIRGELQKAEKGKFPLSLMFLNFENGARELSKDTRSSTVLFDGIRDLFWDTDIFMKFGAKYYLGVFPFCDEQNTEIVKQKMKARFEELKASDPALSEFAMMSIFVSYPFDTPDASKVYDLLIQRIRDTFEDIII